MDVISFVADVFVTNMNTFYRCLSKSNYIYFDGIKMLVCDDKYIYYFGKSSSCGVKEFKVFYDSMLPKMEGKLFYSNNLHNYSSRCELVNDSETPDGKLYKWKGNK